MQIQQHHGNGLRVAALAQGFALFLALSSTTTLAAVPAPSGASLLQAIVKAYGGADTVKAEKNRPVRIHGTISTSSGISNAANSYECDVLEKGDKLRVEMTMLGVPLIMGFDGKRAWQQYGDWVSPAVASTTENMVDDMKHGLNALPDALDTGARAEALPGRSFHGMHCDVLKITTVDGKTSILIADPKTHLILRAEYDGIDHEIGQKVQKAIEYEDYRKVGDTLEPFRELHFSDGKQRHETTIKSAETNVAIDDKVFDMPPETEIARLKDTPMTVPFEYSGNEILIKAKINGGAEQKFIVDTGATQSVIDKAAATALGPRPMKTFSITTGSKAVPLSYTKLPSITIGDITLFDIPVLVTDLGTVQEKPAGIIGANILRRFAVTIDYDEKKLVLSDPRSVNVPPAATAISTKPAFGGASLIVQGQLDNKKPMNFLVDTGACMNNIPLSLAKPLYKGGVLPVGSIFGLDGQRVSIGTFKANTLKLGALAIPGPVFTIAPDRNPSQSGLFTQTSMGILGNPIWSQFKTTIDYRNERLILEGQPGRDKYVQLQSQLESAEREYLKTKNADEALKAFEKVMLSAQVEQQKPIEALAISRMAGCYADKYAKTKETNWLDLATKEYEHALKVANEARHRAIEGQVMAQWALMYLNAPRSYAEVTQAQNLLTKALQKAPMEPSIFAAFGTTMLRVGKKPEAEKLLDRALLLDPSNWQALWAKYKLYQEENKEKERAIIVEQLQHYYPSFPDVIALGPSKPPVVAPKPPSVSTPHPQAPKRRR